MERHMSEELGLIVNLQHVRDNMENYLEEEQPKAQGIQKPHETFLHAPTLERYPFLKWLLPLLLALFIMLLGAIYLLR